MTARTGGEALVAALAAHGVDVVFGIPGTHNLSVFAAMPGHGITNVLPRHEQGGGYAADGYARVTGRPGVCITTTGPAILNAAAAAAQAYSDSVPVLFVSPGMPVGHPALGNGLLHEVKDQSAAMDAVVAYSHRVTSIAEIPAAIAQAFAAMRSGRPRPVHVEIPLDLLDETAEATSVAPVAVPVPAPAPDEIDAAVRMLGEADRPVIAVGGGASGASREVRALAERLGAPVIATTNGKGVLAEDHELSLGAVPQLRAALDLLDDSDAVLAVGTELAPSDWWLGLPDIDGRLVRIDIDPVALTTNASPACGIVADAATALDAVLDRVPAATAATGTERATHWRERVRSEARADGAPWLGLLDALGEALPRDAIVAADNAMVGYYGALSNLPLHRPRSFLFPTGAGTLGYALPAGIGAKLGEPDTPVVVLQGDGGTMFTVAELATAAELGLALPVIVVDNGGYGEIRNEMADRGEPVHGVGLGRPDFAALAESLGCHGVRVTDDGELTAAITRALTSDRPTLLHVRERSRAADALT